MNTIINRELGAELVGKSIFTWLGTDEDDDPKLFIILGLQDRPCGEKCPDCMGFWHKAYLHDPNLGKMPSDKRKGEAYCLNNQDFKWDEEEL